VVRLHGQPTYTLYGFETCGYMTLLVADPDDRVGSKLNGVGTRAREGQAALTFVHELEHQKLATQDEGVVECAAVRALPAVLASIGVRKPGPLLAAARALHFASRRPTGRCADGRHPHHDRGRRQGVPADRRRDRRGRAGSPRRERPS
jgi:hypothetical protein